MYYWCLSLTHFLIQTLHIHTHAYYNDTLEKLFSSIFFLAQDKLIVLLDKGSERETERARGFLAVTVAHTLSLTLLRTQRRRGAQVTKILNKDRWWGPKRKLSSSSSSKVFSLMNFKRPKSPFNGKAVKYTSDTTNALSYYRHNNNSSTVHKIPPSPPIVPSTDNCLLNALPLLVPNVLKVKPGFWLDNLTKCNRHSV